MSQCCYAAEVQGTLRGKRDQRILLSVGLWPSPDMLHSLRPCAGSAAWQGPLSGPWTHPRDRTSPAEHAHLLISRLSGTPVCHHGDHRDGGTGGTLSDVSRPLRRWNGPAEERGCFGGASGETAVSRIAVTLTTGWSLRCATPPQDQSQGQLQVQMQNGLLPLGPSICELLQYAVHCPYRLRRPGKGAPLNGPSDIWISFPPPDGTDRSGKHLEGLDVDVFR
ncbi:hypothetical protein AAFF_G00226960 [Aldrovandia affinis]|uniref:Uncharacterized protein n=1 Tax=Aldrovandia affinis TaxID=143900 RepID=A0AAD7X2K1_9TELE|nr:hypothetical protein AAFF_G00226960 [Aldrovandia affinis]